MSSQDFAKFSIQIAVILACGLLLGRLMRRLRQPAVVGEMLAGILLGPTILGLLAPLVYRWIFPASPSIELVRDAAVKLGMLFFLFTAGLSVDISGFRQDGRKALLIGLIGTLIPIAAGILAVYALPVRFWGLPAVENRLIFALVIGINLANSANPVIARILMDLGLLHSETGTIVMASTIVDDLVNWMLFALILSQVAPSGPTNGLSLPVALTIAVLFFAVILFAGRRYGAPVLHWARARLSWPNEFIMLTAVAVLLASSVSEWLGIHAFLGAFLIGVALSAENDEYEEAHQVIAIFVASFFAPIYFVSMGMSTNFIENLDGLLVLVMILLACVTKIGAVLAGAWLAGIKNLRKAGAIAMGLNARGATGIILAGVALEHRLIDERIFVALVCMAIATTLMAAPAISYLVSGMKEKVEVQYNETG